MKVKEIDQALIQELRNPPEINQFRKDISAALGNTVDKRNEEWRENLDSYMEKYGLTRLGRGNYASVYGNDNYPYVIKVYQRDSAFNRWLDFCLKNQDNPYVPKIKSKPKPIRTDSDRENLPVVYFLKLEKLEPLKGRSESYSLLRIDFDIYRRSPEMYRRKAEQGDSDYDKNLPDIFDYFEKNLRLLDIHRGNVMLRGNQLVIVDPFYNWYRGGGFIIPPDERIPGLI